MIDDMQQMMTWDTGQDTRNVARMFALSALCHVVFFVLVMIMPTSFGSSYRLAPQSISVDLVSLPAGPPAPAAPAPAAPAATAPEPEPEPVVKAEPAAAEAVPLPAPEEEPVSIAPKTKPQKVIKSLKKQTVKDKTVEKTVVQKPAPASKPSNQQTVSKAIESLRQKVATQEKTRTSSSAAAGTGSGSGGGGGSGGTALLTRLQSYKLDVALLIGSNWSFPQQLAGADDRLETLIVFRVLPNGEITDIKIVKSSGNRFVDESAFRAVQKASPVPPHPDGVNEPFIEIGIKGTPQGVR